MWYLIFWMAWFLQDYIPSFSYIIVLRQQIIILFSLNYTPPQMPAGVLLLLERKLYVDFADSSIPIICLGHWNYRRKNIILLKSL